uniref:Phosphatidylinositol-3,4,5-trisphosphate 3-phosphatase n=1 Tax=Mesocestoides corti TaxID=53468 RepID=A0A5K3EU87_MESCO
MKHQIVPTAVTAAVTTSQTDCVVSSPTPVQFADHPSLPESPPLPTKHHPAKMVNRLKSLVSKKKKRFQADGFDLDLSYISSRIIAMGFPAERIEGLYRNHIDEVSRFFEQKHKGHYKIYHLCNERDFNAYRFSGPVVRYPFSDHNAPQFGQILALCKDVMQFLNQHPENVVAINCKAGKGRTGVMVCACLMELQEAQDAEEALRIYAERRTRNGKGVTIPSQRRYVQYYSRLLSSGLAYEPKPLRLTSIRIEGLPHQLHGVQNFELSISTYEKRLSCNHNSESASTDVTSSSYPHTQFHHNHSAMYATIDHSPDCICHCHSEVTTYQIPCSTHHIDAENYLIRLDEPVTVFEDFRIKIKAKSGVLAKKIGQCWLNTFFILDNGAATFPPADISNLATGIFSMSDSNSGSSSSSESSVSTSSSTSSSVRASPPRFARDVDAEEWPTLTSNPLLLQSPASEDSVSFQRSSSSLRSGTSKTDVSAAVNLIPKRENAGYGVSITKKTSPSSNMVSPSLSTQLATPLAVHILELSQSELDAAFKGKKGEAFKVCVHVCVCARKKTKSPNARYTVAWNLLLSLHHGMLSPVL